MVGEVNYFTVIDQSLLLGRQEKFDLNLARSPLVFVHHDQRSYERIAFFYIRKGSYGTSNAIYSREVCLMFFHGGGLSVMFVVTESPPPPT